MACRFFKAKLKMKRGMNNHWILFWSIAILAVFTVPVYGRVGWQRWDGRIPANLVIGGQESGGPLGVCSGLHGGAMQVGKLLSTGRCNFGYGGAEISVATNFSVLVEYGSTQSYEWVNWSGRIPDNALVLSQERDRQMFAINIEYRTGVHPGKLLDGDSSGYIGWGGREIGQAPRQILVNKPCRTIPPDGWLSQLTALLSTASLRLNNFTPNRNEFDSRGERAFFKPNDSFFRIAMNGSQFRLPINIDVAEAGPENRCKVYINDWNTRSVNLRPNRGALLLTLDFESEGIEIVTDCYNNFCCSNSFCPGDGCPDFDLNGSVDVSLRLRISNGRLTYTAEPVLRSRVVSTGDACTNNFWAFLCGSLIPTRENQQNSVRNTIQEQLKAKLNSSEFQTALEFALGRLVEVTGFSDILITDDGSIFLCTEYGDADFPRVRRR